jgi:hypothetical protein
MRRILLILILTLASCYDDDSTLIESENTAHISSRLTRSIKSISLHDASFDDFIDNSSCLSLEFPYQVFENSVLKTINNIQDIELLDENSNIEIVYPVTAVSYNYEKHQINSIADHNTIVSACESSFTLNAHKCLDFQYPVSIKLYNRVGNSFQSINLDHDQDMYVFFDNLQDTDIYEIEYPIALSDHTSGTSKTISSNLGFDTLFNETLRDCQ